MNDKQKSIAEAILKKYYPSLLDNYDVDTLYDVSQSLKEFAPIDALKLLSIVEQVEGYSEAPLAAGFIYRSQGEDKKAVDCFFRASDLGSDCGSCMVGRSLLEGKGIEKDERSGMNYMVEACSRCSADFNNGITFNEWLQAALDCDLYKEAIM